MNKYICIHGHFYQPPRENPWLEAIEQQDTAAPYHDWNERIAAECYGPNAHARILDDERRIARIVNNYASISFNFGPTLLSWLEDHEPEIYRHILRADRLSRERFGGHGSAMAQVYNHMIMPLASPRDRRTQVLWGIRDFQYRFNRAPQGMWLPETAVDLETLAVLVEHGIQFVLLAPHQAARVRPLGARKWHDVADGSVDTSQPYLVKLPGDGEIAVFFYNGPISRAVAFEGLLNRGDYLAGRLTAGFLERESPQLIHIATDGESYGHHHRYGEMALAYALQLIERREDIQLTNYSQYLAKFPPTMEAQILEDTAWSCAHGVGRWQRDCGCHTGNRPDWNQKWRRVLRDSLDWLRDEIDARFETELKPLIRDPWLARDEYIEIQLYREHAHREDFLERHQSNSLDFNERIRVLKALEMQRNMMFSFTSCGWFFDDIAGIEAIQVLRYAARAIQLCDELFGVPLEIPFVERLARAQSNDPHQGNGRDIWKTWIEPARVDLRKVGAHYAVSSLFESPKATGNGEINTYCYTVERLNYQTREAGRTRLALGRARVSSDITYESCELGFGVLHLGDHNITGGVYDFDKYEEYAQHVQTILEAFDRADIPKVIRILDQHFEAERYSIRSLFKDEQRKILDMVLAETLRETENIYQHIYEDNLPLMRFVADLRIPLPRAFLTAAEFAVNSALREEFETAPLDLKRIEKLLDEAGRESLKLDARSLELPLRRTLESLAADLAADPDDLARLRQLEETIAMTRELPFNADLDKVQNLYYEMLKEHYPNYLSRAWQIDEHAQSWISHFRVLGNNLRMRVPEISRDMKIE